MRASLAGFMCVCVHVCVCVCVHLKIGLKCKKNDIANFIML